MQMGSPQREDNHEYSLRWQSLVTPSMALQLATIPVRIVVYYHVAHTFHLDVIDLAHAQLLKARLRMEDTGLDIAGSPTRPAELDFLSPEFSAEQALVCSPSRIQLPCPEVQPCDNLDHYSSVVRGLSRKLAPPPPSSSCPARPEVEKAKCVSLPVQKNVKTVLTFMESE